MTPLIMAKCVLDDWTGVEEDARSRCLFCALVRFCRESTVPMALGLGLALYLVERSDQLRDGSMSRRRRSLRGLRKSNAKAVPWGTFPSLFFFFSFLNLTHHTQVAGEHLSGLDGWMVEWEEEP